MNLDVLRQPEGRAVSLVMEPKLALDVWLHLAVSIGCEETTTASRLHISGLLPRLKRAIVATGYIPESTLTQIQQALARKPQAPAIDQVVGGFGKDS